MTPAVGIGLYGDTRGMEGAMEMDEAARKAAMAPLGAFVGEWSMEVSFAPDGPRARTTFEWILDGRFLLQRTEIAHPAAPNGLLVVGCDQAGGAFTQHYFDSRGIARVYAMTFADGVWTLVRESADFSPLDFAQRFTGAFAADGDTIRGRWESSPDGARWEVDFDLVYRRFA